MPHLSRRLGLSRLLFVLVLLATACSSGETQSTPTTDPTAATVATTTAAPPPSTPSPSTTAATTSAAVGPTTLATIDELLDAGILNIAHAGGDQDYPHSTLYAYAQAAAAGADVLELDVQLSADGVLMVQHDDTVDRTTNGTGKVADLTVAELQALDAAYWFSSVCWRCDDLPEGEYEFRGVRTGEVEAPPGFSPGDFRIATLAELAERFPNHPLDIEIKLPDGDTDKGIEVAEALAAELTRLDRLDSSVVVSFDDAVVDAFHAVAPEVDVSPGLDRLTEWFLNGTPLEPHFRIIQVPPFSSGFQVVSNATVDLAHEQGLAVWVWPDAASWQETEAYYQQILGYGADAVLAGRPGQMTTAREKGPFEVPQSSGCGTAPEPGSVTKTVASGGAERA
ncbi:MAG: hypothetical protein HKN26_09810, partial [Acidimicrobiales bacterium]|nr:hypothetical protein [Acidimicrobiales bacterium]